MAKLASLPERAIISGFKGRLDFYVLNGVPCCRKWPRPHRPTETESVIAQQAIFADAVSLWSTLSQEVRDAYDTMASGSTLSGRDMMVKMYINASSILPY